MFNWLKNKLNILIPSDVKKGMLTSQFFTVKLGEKLTIPADIVCLISYKDKVCQTLSSGNYILDKELLLDIYERQAKKNKKLKKLKLDFFYVNLQPFVHNFTYIDKIPLLNTLTKLIFNVNVKIKVNNPKLFSTFVLSEFSLPNARMTNEYILDCIEEFMKKYYLKKKLESRIIPESQKQELTAKLTQELTKIGLELLYFDFSISEKLNTAKDNGNHILTNNPPSTQNINKSFDFSLNKIDQTEKNIYNKVDHKGKELCSNCNCKIIKGSLFCHRCGQKLGE